MRGLAQEHACEIEPTKRLIAVASGALKHELVMHHHALGSVRVWHREQELLRTRAKVFTECARDDDGACGVDDLIAR